MIKKNLNVVCHNISSISVSTTKSEHLYCHVAIIVVCYHCSDPGPFEANGKLGNGSSLIDITGDGPEEVRKLVPVT